MFGNISGTYDLINRVLSAGRDQKWRKKSVSLLPHGPSIRILDLASGTMDMALQYLKQGEGEVYALDFALPMLLTGQQKVSPQLDPHLHPVCGTADRLPFPDQYFDGAMCAWGVRNFTDINASLAEVRRVLKPGSTFAILEFFRPQNIFSKIFSQTYGKYVIPNIGKFISKDNAAYDYLQSSIRGFFSRKEFEQKLSEYGFEIAASKDLSGGISSLLVAK